MLWRVGLGFIVKLKAWGYAMLSKFLVW